jgi:hypothetical protein
LEKKNKNFQISMSSAFSNVPVLRNTIALNAVLGSEHGISLLSVRKISRIAQNQAWISFQLLSGLSASSMAFFLLCSLSSFSKIAVPMPVQHQPLITAINVVDSATIILEDPDWHLVSTDRRKLHFDGEKGKQNDIKIHLNP